MRVTLLEELPSRVDAHASQISQLRDEMRNEFSAVRGDIQAGDEETRRTLRGEIRAGNERVMDQARVLHEDIVARLALIQEGRGSAARRRKE